MKRRNTIFAITLTGLMFLSQAPGWTAQAAEQILVEEITEVPTLHSDTAPSGSSRTKTARKSKKFQIDETTLPKLFLAGQAEHPSSEIGLKSKTETAPPKAESKPLNGLNETEIESETSAGKNESESETFTDVKETESETFIDAEEPESETSADAEETESETSADAQEPESETSADAEEMESETFTDAEESGSAEFSQGLYEIVSATNIYYLMDVKHCTVQESDSKTVQTFRSLDVNQQKFYIEKLPDNFWRISVVNSGEALTASSDGSAFQLAAMEHPEDAEAADSQSWRLQDAGNGFFYIQSRGGNYVTLDADEAYSGASVILQEFTGKQNQKWLLSRTWISGNAIADTDLVNPYGEDGPCRNLDITLKFGLDSETLTSDELAAHTSENEAHQYVLDPEFLNSYVTQLAAKYDTQGQPRRFMTSHEREITLTEGDFGWKLDVEGTKALINEKLLSDADVTLEPVWAHKGTSFTAQSDSINDIGNSYVEVDLTSQKVWLYKNGRCLLKSDCVSGTMGTGAQTPSGVYSIYYMQSPAVLNGPGYSSPVTYWMPFFGGFGIHDATWRTEFGGEIFRSDGSHGCINLPLESAKAIYNAVEIGYPVILYY